MGADACVGAPISTSALRSFRLALWSVVESWSRSRGSAGRRLSLYIKLEAESYSGSRWEKKSEGRLAQRKEIDTEEEEVDERERERDVNSSWCVVESTRLLCSKNENGGEARGLLYTAAAGMRGGWQFYGCLQFFYPKE